RPEATPHLIGSSPSSPILNLPPFLSLATITPTVSSPMATAPHLAFHLPFPFPSTSRPPPRALAPQPPRRAPLRLAAGRRFRPPTADDEPPEAAEDSSHGLNRYDQLARHVERARKRQQADQPEVTADHPLFSSPPPAPAGGSYDPDDEFFDEIDRAIAEKREEFTRRGLIKPTPPPPPEVDVPADELSPEEAIDLDEIRRLQGLSVASVADEEDEEAEEEYGDEGLPLDEDGEAFDVADELGLEGDRIRQPAFRMTLAELLDESKLVPVAVTGDQDVALSGVQSDATLVAAGDLFVCVGESGLAGLTEADKRGAVAVVADQDVDIEGTLACRALVIVDDITAALRVLPACLYRRPSKDMAVIGITGTDGVTTTSHLVKAMYEAMGVRTGMVGVLGAYAFGSNKLDAQPAASGDSMAVQKLMATMLHNGAEAVVLETTTDEMLPSGVDSEIDYDIAVLTNVRHANLEAVMTYEGYMSSMASLFSRMVDPERHRKVVNIDDPSAPFFAAQGGHGVPVVTYSFENKKADVHTLKYQLSLFETEVLVQTPHGILEISSGLLGRDNIYNILATVAVGVAVGAPLEDIVKGIEEVDAIPGRCELIDEEQAFGVIIDHARTPEALSRLLDSVKELGPRRIVTVVGCCGEKERGKRPMMTKIAAEKSDVVMLTSDNPASEDPLDILDDMLSGVGWTMEEYLKHGANDYYPPLPNGHRLFLHDIRRVAVRAAVAMGEQGDVVVVTGKGNDTYQMEGDKKEFFDDREECREALQYVDQLHRSGIDTSEFPWRLPESH
uniref:UDP-N-acetylmuramoyl-L-alanyl-D-glutamate--2,6-diaminopimelate ligase MurE homolog, chloroplastic n=3 Tax=Triticinae TaxID=1648030 RepID=A0A452YTG7_AEGTS